MNILQVDQASALYSDSAPSTDLIKFGKDVIRCSEHTEIGVQSFLYIEVAQTMEQFGYLENGTRLMWLECGCIMAKRHGELVKIGDMAI